MQTKANELLPEAIRQTVINYTSWLVDRDFDAEEDFRKNATDGVQNAVNGAIGNYCLVTALVASYFRTEKNNFESIGLNLKTKFTTYLIT